ncbi:MAG: acyltransferase family protein [Scandinavium sp.]|uniref:acyltransferase family protein n=1 Tax=Scandinavium sp. TaxID=2830653 RepID=UPI003F40422C
MTKHIRFNHLDGLRGIAALLVVFSHMQQFFGVAMGDDGKFTNEGTLYSLYRMFFNGNFSVCVFFALSGLALLVAFDRNYDMAVIRTSVTKRYLRLTPLVFVSVIFCTVLFSLDAYRFVQANEVIQSGKWLNTVFPKEMNYQEAIYQGVIGAYAGDFSYNGVLWTISKELIGSIFLLGLAGIFYKEKYYGVIVLIISIYLWVFHSNEGAYYSLFFLGSLILRYKKTSLCPSLFIAAGLFLGVQNEYSSFFLWCYHSLKDNGIGTYVELGLSMRCIGALFLVYGVFHSEKAASVLGCKPLKCLGDISFSLYVIHLAFVGSFACWFFLAMQDVIGFKLSGMLAIILTTLISVVVSHLLWRWIDIPSQKYASFIAKKIENKKHVVVSENSELPNS